MTYQGVDPTVPFASAEEQKSAFRDPRYSRDEAYRQAVAAKLAAGKGVTATGERPVVAVTQDKSASRVTINSRTGEVVRVEGGGNRRIEARPEAPAPKPTETDLRVAEAREALQTAQDLADKAAHADRMSRLPKGERAEMHPGSGKEPTPFASKDEVTSAMRHSAYRTNSEYRQWVADRLRMSPQFFGK